METIDQEADLIAEVFGWGKYTQQFESVDQILNPKVDKELPLFFSEWLRNGRNASLAYKTLHPDVSDASARVLGSRKLAKVNIVGILSAFGLTYEIYFQKLKEGLEAKQQNEVTGEFQVDHKTRRIYLKLLGELLGIEQKK